MVSAYSKDRGLTTWGVRGDKQVWRVTWLGRPGMVADVTGPYDTMDALVKLSDEVLERLPWKAREPSNED